MKQQARLNSSMFLGGVPVPPGLLGPVPDGWEERAKANGPFINPLWAGATGFRDLPAFMPGSPLPPTPAAIPAAPTAVAAAPAPAPAPAPVEDDIPPVTAHLGTPAGTARTGAPMRMPPGTNGGVLEQPVAPPVVINNAADGLDRNLGGLLAQPSTADLNAAIAGNGLLAPPSTTLVQPPMRGPLSPGLLAFLQQSRRA